MSDSSSFEPSRKSVLVSYSERRVVFKIPNEQIGGDVKFLVEEFRRKFNLLANVQVTFQRFDDVEWGELIDLEESDFLDDKDKLTAVIKKAEFGDVRQKNW